MIAGVLLAILLFVLVAAPAGPFLVPIRPLRGTLPPEQLADSDSRFVDLDGLKVHYERHRRR
jgi:hypothetical protein